MKNIILSMLVFTVFVFSSCKKSNTKPTDPLSGSYKGTLYADETYDAFRTGPIICAISLKFSDGSYAAVATPTSKYNGYTGSIDNGTFVSANQQITFQNPNGYMEMFDHNLILSGEYTITIKDDSLFLSKKIYDNTYIYKLQKQ